MARKSARTNSSIVAPTPDNFSRVCVYRYEENNGMFIGSNIADLNGMEPYSDYLLSEYLSDELEYEGRKAVTVDGDTYTFSDGTTEILQERCEEIDPEVLAEIFSQYS